MAEVKQARNLYPLRAIKLTLANLICDAAQAVYNVDCSACVDTIVKSALPPKHARSDLGTAVFPLTRKCGVRNPAALATALMDDLKTRTEACELVDSVVAEGAFLNWSLSVTGLARICENINSNGFLEACAPEKKAVMIEYSQPNTHKAFHVGHMRNAALGDSLVRLHEQVGYPVTAVNYFGDEGAHIAKCLWLLKQEIEDGTVDMKAVPTHLRGEFLGERYSKAVEKLDLDTLTSSPYPGVYAAKVLEVTNHSASDAPANWHVCTVTTGEDSKFTVVCGGSGYKVGDIVAYVPVGGKYKGNDVVEKDMKGVTSCGVMMGRTELGLPNWAPGTEPVVPASEQKDEKQAGKKKGKKGKKKKGKGGKKTQQNMNIYVLEQDTPVGIHLPELSPVTEELGEGRGVMEEHKFRQDAVREMLHNMEHGHPEITQLWAETKQWSLDEFKRIYDWLGCRFDHDFFESEVGEESRKLVLDWKDRGVLQMENGAVVAKLEEHKLGTMVLLKSNGTGLYATKDLSLATRKFDQFNIDTSIYVVDASQAHHFKCVFKILELMGYEQSARCVHLPYGLVTIPSGKMSSRRGTVILFSQLVQELETRLLADYLSKHSGVWPQEELDEAVRQVSVATIKYGMLNHDTVKDVVFKIDEWTAPKGNNGPYMMYAYARCRSIARMVQAPEGVAVDMSELLPAEKPLLMALHAFWPAVEGCIAKKNPSGLCAYLFGLAKSLSSWYDLDSSRVRNATPARQAALLVFLEAIAATIKKGLNLLGITTIERM